MFLVAFVEERTVMVTCSGSVLSPPLQHVRELPEFALSYVLWIVATGPVVLLWHGWLPGL